MEEVIAKMVRSIRSPYEGELVDNDRKHVSLPICRSTTAIDEEGGKKLTNLSGWPRDLSNRVKMALSFHSISILLRTKKERKKEKKLKFS